MADPLNVLNLVIKDWDVWSIFAFVNSDVLKIVLSVVTLSSRVI